MAINHDGHISFLGQGAASHSAATPISTMPQKHIENDVHSDYDEEDAIAPKESDFRHKQVCQLTVLILYLQVWLISFQKFKGWTVLWLSYQATGVIYGDIGYTFV
jgi:hypothetical protein